MEKAAIEVKVLKKEQPRGKQSRKIVTEIKVVKVGVLGKS